MKLTELIFDYWKIWMRVPEETNVFEKLQAGWTKTTFHNFETWLWIISHPYNIHVSEYFFDRISSIEPEQTFVKND